MLDPAKPLILVLDPDHDFLEALSLEAKSRDIAMITQPYSRRDPVAIEELIMQHFPDVVVVNLDQTDDTQFASAVLEILRTPTPLAPIVVGTTNKDSAAFKSQAYELGIDDYLIRPFTTRDVWFRLDVSLRTRRLQKQLDTASKKLSALNLQLNTSNRFLEEMTLTDELTGLNNMRFMTQYLDKQFPIFLRNQRAFAIMMIDLDHFKEVNDQNDHLVGSDTIKAVGHIIQHSTRGSDVKARYGGDEYVVAMPETDNVGSKVVGERIRLAVEAHKIIGNEGKEFRVTSSIGVGVFDPQRHTSFKDLIRDADYALYAAKHQGRNQVVIYDHEKMKNRDLGEGYDETQSGVLSELKKIKL